MRHHHSFGQESIIAGLIGAGAVALWFLVIDTIAGRPFATPSILGQVVLFGQVNPTPTPILWEAVAAYTGLHLAAFLIFGAVVTKLVFYADRSPLARFALVMLFVAFEAFFSGLLGMVFAGTRGLFPVWSVVVANTLAAVGMGWYLYRKHPALKRGFAREPLGA